ncbi:MAG: hypothetical protein Q8R28_15895, partial [Dehalococcoidia bacterium]|nr:hypothetical protein [Dehalococcoidia bacterium]
IHYHLVSPVSTKPCRPKCSEKTSMSLFFLNPHRKEILNPRKRFQQDSFAGAFNAACMQSRGVSEIYSWDTDFDGFEGLARLEPPEEG